MTEIIDSLRRDGVRLEICRKNVGVARYAVRQKHIDSMPKEFIPPQDTYSKRLATWRLLVINSHHFFIKHDSRRLVFSRSNSRVLQPDITVRLLHSIKMRASSINCIWEEYHRFLVLLNRLLILIVVSHVQVIMCSCQFKLLRETFVINISSPWRILL